MQVSATLPSSVHAFIVGASLVGATLLAATLMAGAERTSARDRHRRTAAIAVAIALAAWYATTSAIAAAGGFRADAAVSATFPMIGLGVVVPVAIGALAVWSVGPLGRLVADPGIQPALIAVQAYRVIAGSVFLVLMGLGYLPAVFAIPAGAGDVLVGLTALPTAAALRAGRRGTAVVWNLLGLFDLVVAVGLGVLTSPGAVHVIQASPTTLAMSSVPLVAVPTYLVPLSALLHVVSLRALAVPREAVRAVAAAVS